MGHRRREMPKLAEGDRWLCKVRRVRNGPLIACEITVNGGVVSIAEDGKTSATPIPLTDVDETLIEWATGETLHPVMRALMFGQPIEEPEYRYLLTMGAWAREHAPSHPAAKPDEPIDINTIPIDMIF